MKKKDANEFIINTLETRCNMGYSINDILNKEGLEKILFDDDKTDSDTKCVDIDIFNYLKSKNCDMSEINFDNVQIMGLDFTGLKGVNINPSGKILKNCIFNGVTFVGTFDNAYIALTDFTGSNGAVIDVSKLRNQSIYDSIMCDVTFIGSFEEVDLYDVNFKGSKGAKINPNKLLRYDSLVGTVLDGVEFTEPISNCFIDRADFTGSKNAVIIADDRLSFKDTVLTDTIVLGEIIEECKDVVTDGVIFLGNIVNKNEEKVQTKISIKRKRYVGKHEK